MTAPCVFVTGIWKSGNHLAYSALNEMGVQGPFNGISGHLLFGRHAWLKKILRSPRGADDAVQVGLETDVHVSGRYIARAARKLSGRILGGHAAHTPDLERILQDNGARMICIRRDPRDILVSFADWIGSRPDFYLHPDFKGLSRNERVALLLRGGPGKGYVLTPFAEVLQRAEGWLHSEAVLQVSFEGLIGASGGGSPEEQRAMVQALHTHVAPPKSLDEIDQDRIYGGTLTFNKGRSQRWKELDDPALIDDIQTRLGPHLASWGYGEDG